MSPRKSASPSATVADEIHMRELVKFTAKTMATDRPVPFGALIVSTKTGEPLQRALNAVAFANDPSAHAELRTIRLACKKLRTTSLAGYTLYSTCEPCPMCMANALWARVDRVVFGATIEDANRHCNQIHIPAEEVSRRSDMPCRVEGPVLRELCYALFSNPNMLRCFSSWTSARSSIKTGPLTSTRTSPMPSPETGAKPSEKALKSGIHKLV